MRHIAYLCAFARLVWKIGYKNKLINNEYHWIEDAEEIRPTGKNKMRQYKRNQEQSKK